MGTGPCGRRQPRGRYSTQTAKSGNMEERYDGSDTTERTLKLDETPISEVQEWESELDTITIHKDPRRDAQIKDGIEKIVNSYGYKGTHKVKEIVKDISKPDLLWSLPRIYKGNHLTHPKVTMTVAREIDIQVKKPAPLQADGELLGEAPARFSILPEILSLAI